MTSRFQRFLRAAAHMLSRYEPPKRPSFPVDNNLLLRQAMQRDLIGDRPIKALIESQPDTIKRGNETVPVDYERGLPVG